MYIYIHTHIYFSRFFYLIDYYKIMSIVPSPTDPAVKGNRMTDSKMLPLWHVGYFELTAFKTLLTQENLLSLH